MSKFTIVIVFFLATFTVVSQTEIQLNADEMLRERGEVYFSFPIDEELTKERINYLSRIISIDNVNEAGVYAYASRKTWPLFKELGIEYQVLIPPSMLHQPRMLDSDAIRGTSEWDYYPTYQAYLDIMNGFAEDYPDLCEVVNIKTLDSGRKLLMIHINDSLGVVQGEPEFLYTSSMHGDEVTGYVLTLHLIEYLLENYGSDDQVNNLVKNVDIWINPLANPDGTYAGGNDNIFGATRSNGNGVNLNRNYPDPEDGPHPDGNAYQEETVAFMDFADDHNFVMGANFHGGAEVCNYPWDTWSKRHPDDDWWIYVCRQYADTVHEYAPAGYLTDLDNGISNGYDWYSISGGRQDYMNYFQNCREFTLEISAIKMPPASQMPNFWEYNYRSMLNYMEQSLYGLRGSVTNSASGNSVPAEVFADGHDEDNSQVYAFLPAGDYHRPIKAGTYDFTFSSFGYYSKTIKGVEVTDDDIEILNVQLDPYVSLTADFYASDTIITIDESTNFFDTSLGNNIVSWEWNFEGGEPETSSEENPTSITYSEAGLFDVTLKITDNEGDENTMLKENYIRVTEIFEMKDTTVYVCDGMFYDTGGQEEDYSDDEDITMTFISFLESGKLKVTFREFDVETEENCNFDYLEAFDGKDVNAPLIGKWCGTDLPETFSTSNIDGAVTFRFSSNSMITRPGWKAEITCDTSVGFQENDMVAVNIFPNPSKGKVTVESPYQVNKLVVYDLSGNAIMTLNVPSTQKQIALDGLSPGLYVLEIETESGSFKQKLMIH